MTEEKRCDAATSDLPQSNQATQSSESQQEQQESEPALTTIQIFWTATPEGRVEKDHPVWRAFTGQSQKEMKGFGWLRTIHPDDLERVKREWSGAVERKSALSTEYRLRRADGIYRLFEVHGIPIFKKRGSALREWVGVYVDVTERRQMEEQLRQNQQRTNDALNALLSMAEALVLLPEAAQHAGADDVPLGPTSDPMARYLARLTCKVLDCRGVSLLSMETQTEVLYPIGVAGVTAEYKRSWWMAQEQQKNRLSTSFTAEQIARLQANEVLLFESGQPQSYSLLAPNLTRVALIVPMKVGHQLVGLLILDHGETNYRPGSEEVTLARAVARLAAMVIER
ncbi:MAG: PAS domain-containing protein, partial [Ktedonobacteraceae bacterium]|nr:PAS domain-containing protein [Ktedonobacteraceae bacterium]